LNDATGALPYENDAGYASAEEIHRAFTVVMHSRFAAVVNTNEWIEAVQSGRALAGGAIAASNKQARERAAASV
jgi:hypothetical protein